MHHSYWCNNDVINFQIYWHCFDIEISSNIVNIYWYWYWYWYWILIWNNIDIESKQKFNINIYWYWYWYWVRIWKYIDIEFGTTFNINIYWYWYWYWIMTCTNYWLWFWQWFQYQYILILVLILKIAKLKYWYWFWHWSQYQYILILILNQKKLILPSSAIWYSTFIKLFLMHIWTPGWLEMKVRIQGMHLICASW